MLQTFRFIIMWIISTTLLMPFGMAQDAKEPSSQQEEIIFTESDIQKWREEKPRFTPDVELYTLSANGNNLVSWNAPDGFTYSLSYSNLLPNVWYCTNDVNGNPAICYKKFSNGADAILWLTLKGANSISCTLLHREDDTATHTYIGTDGGNNSPIGTWSFALRRHRAPIRPVANWAAYQVMCVR